MKKLKKSIILTISMVMLINLLYCPVANAEEENKEEQVPWKIETIVFEFVDFEGNKVEVFDGLRAFCNIGETSSEIHISNGIGYTNPRDTVYLRPGGEISVGLEIPESYFNYDYNKHEYTDRIYNHYEEGYRFPSEYNTYSSGRSGNRQSFTILRERNIDFLIGFYTGGCREGDYIYYDPDIRYRADGSIASYADPFGEMRNKNGEYFSPVEIMYNTTRVYNTGTGLYEFEENPILSLTIKVRIQKPDWKIDIESIPGIGETIQIIAGPNNVNMFTLESMKESFENKGIKVKGYQNWKGGSVTTNPGSLQVAHLHTGMHIVDSTGKTYPVIIYGDAAGYTEYENGTVFCPDGKIDALDIAFVIDEFLTYGEGINYNYNSEIYKEAYDFAKIAGDVHNDGKLDAADMALMINSFLGNLDEYILVK